MKYLCISVLFFSAFSCKTVKDINVPPKTLNEEVFELNLAFKPNSEYVTDLNQVTNTVMSIPNMPDQSTVNNMSSTSTLKFGPMIDDQCEMLIVYDKMDMQMTGAGDQQFEQPELVGMKIHGKLIEGVQSIDSIVGGDPTLQVMIESIIEPMFSNIKIDFPNPMKIGDEFLDTKVIDIPIEGMGSTSITTDTKYMLSKVVDNIAELTTQIELAGKMSMMGKEIPIKGTGSGVMSIDMEGQYSPSSSTDIDQEIIMEVQGMTMKQKIKLSMETKTRKVK